MPSQPFSCPAANPVVLNNLDSIGVDITPPDSGGTGIGSAVNFIINGDTDIV